MATRFWQPRAASRAQFQTTAGIDILDTTYTAIRSTIGGATITGTVGANWGEAVDNFFLAVLLGHPYFDVITWSREDYNSGGTDYAKLTAIAKTAGVPFGATLEQWDGSAWSLLAWDSSATIFPTGKTFFDNTENWSGGTLPTTGDDVYFTESDISCCYGFTGSMVLLNSIIIDKSYSGLIGLNPNAFARSEDGRSTTDRISEYRAIYPLIKADLILTIGIGRGSGSGRINIATGGTAAKISIYDTATRATDTNRAAVTLWNMNDPLNVFVYNAPGGVELKDNSDCGTITVNATDPRTWIKAKRAASVKVLAGNAEVGAVGTSMTGEIYEGTLKITGTGTAATIDMKGSGRLKLNNQPSSGNAVTRLNIYAGILDLMERLTDADLGSVYFYGSTKNYEIRAPFDGCFNPAATHIEDGINWIIN